MKRSLWILVLSLVCGACARSQSPVTVEFRIAEPEPGEGLTEMVFTGWDQEETFYLHHEVLLSGSDIVSAKVVSHRDTPAVEVLFTDAGRAKLARITAANINKHMAMVVDGKLACAPLIRAEITVGRAIVNGDFTDAEARRIAEGLGAR